MEVKKVMRWNVGASIVYAVGVWTMVGSYFYFKYTGKYDTPPESAIPPIREEKEANPNEVVYKTTHSTSVITYKKDFVPFSTRLMNLISSFTGNDAAVDRDSSK